MTISDWAPLPARLLASGPSAAVASRTIAADILPASASAFGPTSVLTITLKGTDSHEERFPAATTTLCAACCWRLRRRGEAALAVAGDDEASSETRRRRRSRLSLIRRWDGAGTSVPFTTSIWVTTAGDTSSELRETLSDLASPTKKASDACAATARRQLSEQQDNRDFVTFRP